jgi:hypothetical protein
MDVQHALHGWRFDHPSRCHELDIHLQVLGLELLGVASTLWMAEVHPRPTRLRRHAATVVSSGWIEVMDSTMYQ